MSKLAEPIAQNMIRILTSAMPSILQKINNEYALLDGSGQPGTAAAGVPLPAIKNFYFGQRSTTPSFPCIVVDPRSAHIDSQRFHFQWADYDHTVHVDILLQSDNEDVLSRQLLRYARAVWEVMFFNQLDIVGNQVAAISLKPVAGGATDVIKMPETNLLFRGYKWVFECHRFDDLG